MFPVALCCCRKQVEEWVTYEKKKKIAEAYSVFSCGNPSQRDNRRNILLSKTGSISLLFIFSKLSSCGTRTNLLYGGSFSKFIQVADVGNRSKPSSVAMPAALERSPQHNFQVIGNGKQQKNQEDPKKCIMHLTFSATWLTHTSASLLEYILQTITFECKMKVQDI